MNLEVLSNLDPDCFTIEEVAALLGCWRWLARLVLSTGVRRGEFELLPDGRYRLLR